MTFHPSMFQKLKPHSFTVGEQTYRNVKSLIEPVNQSIIVSGESGAGKVGEPIPHLSTSRLSGWAEVGSFPMEPIAAMSLPDRLA